jgi:hypothetical protein
MKHRWYIPMLCDKCIWNYDSYSNSGCNNQYVNKRRKYTDCPFFRDKSEVTEEEWKAMQALEQKGKNE